MNNRPLVSVIMNCYNSDKYLKEAIDSVIAQTYTNWEIIFWNNQSTDKSAEIVNSYKDSRIRYFYADEHTTLGKGRNKALEKACGEFISFLDCDDLYLHEKIEKTINKFDSDDVGLVYTNGFTLFNEKNTQKAFYKNTQLQGNLYEEWIASYQVMIPSVMFRKKVLNSLEYWFDERFSMIEEFDFFIRISEKWKTNYLDEKVCIWRAHSESLTWKKQELFEKENKLFLENILKKYPELEKMSYIQMFKAKIAYHEFYNKWSYDDILDRSILVHYLFIDKRLIVIYFLSFFGLSYFNKILKVLGKNV